MISRKEYNIILFSVTLCWASSYIFIKDLPSGLSSFAYLTLTAGIAGVILLAIFHRMLKNLDRRTVLRGFFLAVFITGNMLLEKLGLDHIPSSTASFLASLNIVIVPLILLFLKKSPTKNNIVGILVIMMGLFVSNGIVSSTSDDSSGFFFMFGACVLMSIYTVASTEFTKQSDPLVLCILQLCFSAVIGFILWSIEDPATFANIEWSNRMLSSIFILAFFSKAYAYIMLMYAEKYADAISVTVIASTEPVVTLTLALLIPNSQGEAETFSMRALIGAVIIALGAFVANSNFLSSKEELAKAEVAKKKAATETKAQPQPSKTQTTISRVIRRVNHFLVTMIPFAVLGAAFKVMVLVEGFTEVRPANAIPMISGYLFGPFGAIGCAVGNLIADFFGTLNLTSLLGVVGNFMAAYVPYRMWYAISREKPNVHSWKNILIFLWTAYVSALVCAWILGFGLELFFSTWIDTIYKYVLLNNFGFSIALGLPVFILTTSDSIHLSLHEPTRIEKPHVFKGGKWVYFFLAAATVLFTCIAVGVYMGYHLSTTPVMGILSILAGVCLILIFLLPVKKGAPVNEQ